jgi:predicted ATPase
LKTPVRSSRAPFLKSIAFRKPAESDDYPFTVPLFSRDFDVAFLKPVSIFVGENGAGKSTLLEAIALHCGFNAEGGSRDHQTHGRSDVDPVLDGLRFSWLPRVTTGFFFRAESFFAFSNYIDMVSEGRTDAYSLTGGRSLHHQSHGEAFLALFSKRLGGRGVYIFDEPEAALSPARQMTFLTILRRMELTTQCCQIIMATHSPILMSYPFGELFSFEGSGELREISFKASEHWKLYGRFLANPEKFHDALFEGED